MYYPNLENLKELICKDRRFQNEAGLLVDQIPKLDRWLAVKPPYAKLYLNSNYFAEDFHISPEISLTLFMTATEVHIFEAYYEVRDIETAEFLGEITESQYHDFLNGNLTEVELDMNNVYLFPGMVIVYFKFLLNEPSDDFLGESPVRDGNPVALNANECIDDFLMRELLNAKWGRNE